MITSTRIVALPLAALMLLSCSGDPPIDPPPPPTLGNAVINWEIVDEAGDPVTCEELGVSDSRVAFGREEVMVPCGDPQTVRFDDQLAGNYAVVVTLLVGGLGRFEERVANLLVVAGDDDSELTIVFELLRETFNTGSAKVTWRLQDMDPAVACSMFEVDKLLFETDESSIATFMREANCEEGEFVLEALRTGRYEMDVKLVNRFGNQVGTPRRPNFQINRGEQVQIDLFFLEELPDPAQFEGTWTITGTTAATGCIDNTAETVRVRIETIPIMGQPPEIASATVACDAGFVEIDNLPSGPQEVRAIFSLVSEFQGTLDVESVRGLFLNPARTATAAVNFLPQGGR